jgi:predicted lactoylglutathione lyase
MADQQRDVIEVLEHDHREVDEMFAELESLGGAATEEDEEGEMFAHMRQVIDKEELRTLGARVEAFKGTWHR